jgi:hypothetical protein
LVAVAEQGDPAGQAAWVMNLAIALPCVDQAGP